MTASCALLFPPGILELVTTSSTSEIFSPSDCASLTSLPMEILIAIFDNRQLTSFDLICSMLTCKLLARRLYGLYRKKNDHEAFAEHNLQQVGPCIYHRLDFQGFCNRLADRYDVTTQRFCHGCQTFRKPHTREQWLTLILSGYGRHKLTSSLPSLWEYNDLRHQFGRKSLCRAELDGLTDYGDVVDNDAQLEKRVHWEHSLDGKELLRCKDCVKQPALTLQDKASASFDPIDQCKTQ